MSNGFDWHLTLLAMLAAAAFFPARHVWRFIRTLTVPPDITQRPLPPLNAGERRILLLCFVTLPALLAAATLVALAPHPLAALPFIFTGVLGLALCVVNGVRAVQGLRTGTAVVKGRGWSGTYSRAAQPVRFWLATVFNGFGSAFIGLCGLVMIPVALHPTVTPPPTCFVQDTMAVDHCSVIVHQREIRALSKEIANDPDDAAALERRARLYESTDDLDHARADWDHLRVIRDREGRRLTGG